MQSKIYYAGFGMYQFYKSILSIKRTSPKKAAATATAFTLPSQLFIISRLAAFAIST